MKSTEACESIVCTCPYCKKELNFIGHLFCYEPTHKAVQEVCYKCGKTFWLKYNE
jgi:hypothetical protein